MDTQGKIKPFEDHAAMDFYMDKQASRSMRMLAVACIEGDSDEGDLTLLCVLSIRDNVRPEAAAAIKEVQAAGVQVVMVTGDRKETAVAIAKEADLIAQQRYKTSIETFLIGKINTLDLNDAQSSKDAARQKHISELYYYWYYFYQIRSLTLWDFRTNTELEADFDEIVRQ